MSLPLHRGGAVRTPGASEQFSKAMSKGLNLVGMAKTKGGSDDKEVAYVLRQNSLLRLFTCLILFGIVFSMILFSTVLELSVARRGLIRAEIKHHRIEKAEHEDFVRINLELQKALQMGVQETRDIEEFRAHFQKAIGTHSNSVLEALKTAQVSKEVLDNVAKSTQALNKDIQEGLGKIIHKFLGPAKEAQKKIHTVSGDIIKDVEQEARLEDSFRKKMASLGEDPYANDSGNDDDDDDESDDYGDEDPKEEEQRKEDKKNLKARVTRDEKELDESLSYFFQHLESLKMPDIPESVLESWINLQTALEKTFEDDNKEADVEATLERFQKISLPGVPKYDPTQYDSVIDYIDQCIEEAKLIKHKTELSDLYQGYLSHRENYGSPQRISVYTVVATLERIAEEKDLYLLFDWLQNLNPSKPGDFKYDENSDKKKNSNEEKIKEMTNDPAASATAK